MRCDFLITISALVSQWIDFDTVHMVDLSYNFLQFGPLCGASKNYKSVLYFYEFLLKTTEHILQIK